ncbi:hypothetical protein B0T22DRAFT_512955 [Podospora appendiculata]|uniref:RGS domain-containing protein n=1 Tax=Podospora appendiculata TaxID=314037 RepID=A0AAE1CD22_9PEZI|nr:hypothetical protein B0T22DRAFT_512955 [Podospora appendiculata]
MRFPTWLKWYKKPEYRDIKEYATGVASGRRSLSPDRSKTAIPSRLRLERILENKTCSPMSLYDFYMYLKYIEFSAENLEFYIWCKNYEADYVGVASEKEKAFVTADSASDSSTAVPNTNNSTNDLTPVEEGDEDPEITKETLFRISQLISADALCSSKSCARRPPIIIPGNPGLLASTETATTPAADQARSLNVVSAPIQRAELDTVIDLFLSPGGEKELNIPPAMREQAIADLRVSSHPAALKPVADHVYGLLRNCSHRNFVRLGVGNGTFETICVATMLGFVNIAAGFLVIFCRAFAPFRGAHSMWEAFAAWPLWWLGVSLVLSGLRGSCFFLLLFSRRQRLPWERFDDSGSVLLSNEGGLLKALSRLMIFDRRLRVKERHLRRLQRKIVMQSLLGGAVFASAGVLVFIFLPIWRETIH